MSVRLSTTQWALSRRSFAAAATRRRQRSASSSAAHAASPRPTSLPVTVIPTDHMPPCDPSSVSTTGSPILTTASTG